MSFLWRQYNRTIAHIAPTLVKLNCESNQLSRLPALPDTLKVLRCGMNALRVLPQLPFGLINLSCPDNFLNFLPESFDALGSRAEINITKNLFDHSFMSSIRKGGQGLKSAVFSAHMHCAICDASLNAHNFRLRYLENHLDIHRSLQEMAERVVLRNNCVHDASIEQLPIPYNIKERMHERYKKEAVALPKPQ